MSKDNKNGHENGHESEKTATGKRVLQPAGWAPPRGYANGVAASGTLVSVAGQIGWNGQCQFESDDFIDQCRQALSNIKAVLAEAGAEPRHIVRMTWYLLDKREYVARGREIGRASCRERVCT